jgi:hypothetical protein
VRRYAQRAVRKYRGRIVALADERRSADLSLAALHDLLQEFQETAATLAPATVDFVCDELADQLEHEAIRSTRKRRQDLIQKPRKKRHQTVQSGGKW